MPVPSGPFIRRSYQEGAPLITGREVVEYAALIGTGRPYVLGAVGPNAYDCSGLILAVFKHFGIATFPNIAHEAGAQARWLATHGQQISIGAASATPGAVLAIDKGWTGVGAGGNHIGFCRTPGISFEARSRVFGIGSWPLSDHKWTGGYLIPGVDYRPPIEPEPPVPPSLEDEVPYVMQGLEGFQDIFAMFDSGVVRQMTNAEYEWLKSKNIETIVDKTADGRARLCKQAGVAENELTPR